jgi:MFS family permease
MTSQPVESYVDIKQFHRSVAMFRGTIGFMSGMFLFLFGPIVHEALVTAQRVAANGAPVESGEFMPLGYDPLQWTAIMFAVGIILEFMLEIPTGMFADILGRKVAIIGSMVFRFINLGLMFLLIVLGKVGQAPGPVTVIAIVVVYWIFYSLFFTLQDGAYEAWVKSFLEEKKRPEDQALVFARGENWSNALFLIGAIIGVLLWSYQLPHFAYLAGMGVTILCACTCGLYLPETRKRDLRGDARPRQKWSEVFRNSMSELKNRRLMVVFFMNAAVTSLTYLINLSLFIFFKNHFFEGSEIGEAVGKLPNGELRWWSVGTTFALAFMTLLGNLVFSRWLRRRLQAEQGLGVRMLVWINTIFNLCLAIPVLVASTIFSDPDEAIGRSFLLLLIALMVVHKLAASTYRVAVMTLQNDLIPSGKKETATILSLGATMKNFVIVFLIIVGVGKQPASLWAWMWPALVVLATTAAMLAFVREKARSGVEPTEDNFVPVPPVSSAVSTVVPKAE